MNTTMKKAKMITVAIAAVIVSIVVLQNTDSVQTEVLVWSVTMPLAALLLVTVLTGFALGVLISTFKTRKR